MSEEELFDAKLKEALRSQPEMEWSVDFSEKVMHKIEKRALVGATVTNWMYIAVTAGFLFAAVLSLLIFTDISTYSGWLSGGAYIVSLVVLLMIFQVLDEKFIRTKLRFL